MAGVFGKSVKTRKTGPARHGGAAAPQSLNFPNHPKPPSPLAVGTREVTGPPQAANLPTQHRDHRPP
ncbi:MAG: hypothetical protein ACKOJF_15725, partial [Planctomycetaceae bacterium]